MIEFKAWDKRTKQMIFQSLNPEAEMACNFTINLDGTFSVTQRVLCEGIGVRSICRESEDFELFFSIGLTTKDNKKLFPGDVISDKNGNRVVVCYGLYKSSTDSWGIEPTHFGCFITFNDGGTYALSQDGGGYSLAAGECTHLGHTYEQ